jgi:hypothetical protein
MFLPTAAPSKCWRRRCCTASVQTCALVLWLGLYVPAYCRAQQVLTSLGAAQLLCKPLSDPLSCSLVIPSHRFFGTNCWPLINCACGPSSQNSEHSFCSNVLHTITSLGLYAGRWETIYYCVCSRNGFCKLACNSAYSLKEIQRFRETLSLPLHGRGIWEEALHWSSTRNCLLLDGAVFPCWKF